MAFLNINSGQCIEYMVKGGNSLIPGEYKEQIDAYDKVITDARANGDTEFADELTKNKNSWLTGIIEKMKEKAGAMIQAAIDEVNGIYLEIDTIVKSIAGLVTDSTTAASTPAWVGTGSPNPTFSVAQMKAMGGSLKGYLTQCDSAITKLISAASKIGMSTTIAPMVQPLKDAIGVAKSTLSALG
jgi:hypothetical protein